MARRPPQLVTAPKLRLTADDMRAGVARLTKRIDEVKAFDVEGMKEHRPPELSALAASITQSLERTFGENTADTKRFAQAAELFWRPVVSPMDGRSPPVSEAQQDVGTKLARSQALLETAVRGLEEEIVEQTNVSALTAAAQPEGNRDLLKVFVVHGHDEGAREAVARFLERLGFTPVILHEQANQGRTVIEKVEENSEVGFAVILLTPDDVGCVKDGTLAPRARQNVLIELGYFIGRLGRKHVCALKRGELEIPSDFAGVVYETFDSSGGWKQALGRELEAAGYPINWNAVMRQ